MTDPARVAIYARFSNDDLQDGRSIDDQVVICRDYAARHGWRVVAVYADHGISGASIFNRPEYQRMMQDAQARRFEILLAEDVDRYGRGTADNMRFYEIATFHDLRIFTIADGEATDLVFGFKSITSARFLKDLALKIRRGMEGRVRAGASPGGRAYGYAPVPGKPGQLTIVEAEAEIVRRIYREFVAGRTPRDIVRDLNRDRIRPPRGTQWQASALCGNAKRGYGILVNALYRGTIVWNRVRMVKDPETGRRISRINAADMHRSIAVPALAIVPAELAAQVDARLADRRHHAPRPEQNRRPRHLLSGLLRCGACGGGLSTSGVDKSGRKRLRCTTDAEGGICPAPATFYLDQVERLTLERLRAEFRNPQVISEYVREYHAQRERRAGAQNKRRDAIEKRLGQIEREIKRAVDAIVQGVGDAAVFGERTKQLAAEREALTAELATLAERPKVVALVPAVLQRFEQQCERLTRTLAETVDRADPEAASAIRDLVESVTVARAPERPHGLAVTIVGRLESLTATPRPTVWGTSVAGERYRRSPHPQTLRFQLAG